MKKITKEMTITTYGDFANTKALLKKAWKFVKPSVKKAVQKAIVWLHKVVSKLEVYLLEKIDEVEDIIDEIPE